MVEQETLQQVHQTQVVLEEVVVLVPLDKMGQTMTLEMVVME